MSFSRILFFRQLFPSEKLTLFGRCYSQNVYTQKSSYPIQTYLKYVITQHNDPKTPDKSKQRFEMQPVYKRFVEQRFRLYDNIESLKNSKKLNKVREEACAYLKRIKAPDTELQSILLKPQLTEGGILLEVTAGAGNQEAMLFARELFEMYKSYAKYKDWKVDIAFLEKSDTGGIKKASMLIKGLGVPELMKMECGVHRVEKVPASEKGRRIHTSTVSVSVWPQPCNVEMNIPERDIVIKSKQHANTAGCVVQIVHVPTRIIVESQEGRSLIENKEIAMQKLKTLLFEKQHQEQAFRVNERKLQIDSCSRNQKIRTYSYPQDQVTEHREGGGIIQNLQEFMQGGQALENLQESLLRQQKHKAFLDDINEFTRKQSFART